MNGAFFIDKDTNCTSRDVVNEIIKKVETIKVGHTGTLDPLATGVLVVCVGKATKLVNLLMALDKEYEAEITLGILTDTYDIMGHIIKEERPDVSRDDIVEVLKEFVGEYEQEVPIYSAVKINGKKLYEYARAGQTISLPKRLVKINAITLIDEPHWQNDHLVFKIHTNVSKGTYIRSLVNDIATKLGTIGTLTSLRRTKLGNIDVRQCKTIDQLHLSDLVPVKDLLGKYPCIVVDEVLKKAILNGRIIDNVYGEDLVVFVDQEQKVLAVYKKYEKNDKMMKPEVMLGGV